MRAKKKRLVVSLVDIAERAQKKRDQEAFNIVYRALVKQGYRAVSRKGICTYRAPDGSKCAIGHLIPDQWYSRGFAGKPISYVIPRVPGLDRITRDLLGRMMSAHDNHMPLKRSYYRSITEWRAVMKEIADTMDLTIPRVRETA